MLLAFVVYSSALSFLAKNQEMRSVLSQLTCTMADCLGDPTCINVHVTEEQERVIEANRERIEVSLKLRFFDTAPRLPGSICEDIDHLSSIVSPRHLKKREMSKKCKNGIRVYYVASVFAGGLMYGLNFRNFLDDGVTNVKATVLSFIGIALITSGTGLFIWDGIDYCINPQISTATTAVPNDIEMQQPQQSDE